VSEEEKGKVFIKSNNPEPLVVDKEGNIYYSAKVINELENEEKQKLEQEIERLNNIINEFEKFLFGELQIYGGGGIVQEYYDKLQELKGSE
jgi:pantothenate kinase